MGMMRIVGCMFLAWGCAAAYGQGAPERDARALQIRERYLTSLEQNPLQAQAFDRVYASYLEFEGIDAWIAELEERANVAEQRPVALALLARIHHRQFHTAQAIAALEESKTLGLDQADVRALLGRLYAESGQFEQAIGALKDVIGSIADDARRVESCRILGDAHMRLGQRDDAIAAWRKLIELAPNDPFAYEELAGIYEDHRMWSESIDVRRLQLERAQGNPYLQCRTFRAMGRVHERNNAIPEAIAAYEQGLSLAAPGNWLFDELKRSLTGVYEKQGDLEGFQKYLEARVAQSASDIEFQDMLADVLVRRGKPQDAERVLLQIVERAPDRSKTFESLISLYTQTGDAAKARATFETLIERFPEEPDYLRRLGESYLLAGEAERAKATWLRAAPDGAAPESLAMVAAWHEQYEFMDDAMALYERAIARKRDPEWVFRLAGLKYDSGATEEAVSLWQSTLTAESTGADYASVAAILASHDRDDDAIAMYRKAIEVEPAAFEYQASLARLLLAKKAYDEALPVFTALSEQTANEHLRGVGESGMIDVFVATGTLEQKRAEWQAEVNADAKNVAARLRLSRLLHRMGDREGALQLLLQCAEIEPENVEHWRTLGAAYAAQRKVEPAIETYRKLTELDATRSGLYFRELARLYGMANRKEESIAAAEKVVELAPGDVDAHLTLAQTYMTHGRTDDGLKEYRTAIRLEPDKASHHRQYGDALSGLDRPGEAQEAYRAMLDTSANDMDRFDAIARLAAVYRQQEREQELVDEFQTRLRNAPKSLMAYAELASVYRAMGDYARVVDTLESAIGNVEDTEGALRQLLVAASDAGNLEKVVRVHQQLMALSGMPSMFEWDRLGTAYAQLGDMEKAIESWMHITADFPDDAAAHKLFARTTGNWGLIDESLAARKTAIELDPSDYGFRLEYAQTLASFDRVDEAMEELFALLEASQLDDGQAAAAPPSSPQPMPQQYGMYYSGTYPGHSRYGIRPVYGGRHGGSPAAYGTLAYYRPQIISLLVETARRTDTTEEVIKRLVSRLEAMPGNVLVKRDLLDIYLQLGRQEDAVGLAVALAELQPKDVGIRQQLAMLYRELKRFDDAERVFTEVAQLDPAQSLESRLAIMHLRHQRGDKASALQMGEAILAERPDDASMAVRVAQFMQLFGERDRTRQLYERAIELDAANAQNYRVQLASLWRERGDLEQARANFEAVLFAPATPNPQQQPVSYARQPVQLLSPDPYGGGQPRRGNLQQMSGMTMDYSRLNALQQIVQMTMSKESLAALGERLRESAETYFTADSDEARRLAETMVWLYLSYVDMTDGLAAASDLIKRLYEKAPDDPGFRNLMLYSMNDASDWDGMLAMYDRIAQRDPLLGRQVQQAKFNVAIRKSDFEMAVTLFREMLQHGQARNELSVLMQRMGDQGQWASLIALLEGERAAGRQDAFLMQSLANAYGQSGQHEKSIALAREMWERSQRGPQRAQRSPGRYGSVQFAHDPAFTALSNAYSRAGRLPDLATEFEGRLEKQPSSTMLRECLIQLYQNMGRSTDAVRLYRELANLRPNSIAAKTELAQFLMNQNQAEEAVAIYEEILARQPSMYFSMTWQVRQAYQALGKQQELAKIETQMVERATNVNQLEQIAQQFLNDREFDKAAEAFERALKMDPTRQQLRGNIAEAYRQGGKIEQAIQVYNEHLKFIRERGGAYADFYLCKNLVSVYVTAERLGELKAESEKVIEANPGDRLAKALLAEIASHEGRYADAMKLLEELYVAQTDSGTIRKMVDVAEAQRDFDKAIDLVENKLFTQGDRDWRRLAKLYIAKGDKAKAFEVWQREAAERNDPWGATQVLRNLTENAMWEEAIAYYETARTKASGNQSVTQQLDQTMIEASERSTAIMKFAEEKMFDSITGNEVHVVRQFLNRLDGDHKKQVAYASRMLERFPDNADIISLYLEYVGRDSTDAKFLDLYAKLTQLRPDQQHHVWSYVNRLASAGRIDEAVTVLADWTAQTFDDARIDSLAKFISRWDVKRKIDLTTFQEQFVAKAPADRQLTLKAALANVTADVSGAVAAKAIMQEAYLANPKGPAYAQYQKFLLQHGYVDEALALHVLRGDEGEKLLQAKYPGLLLDLLLTSGDIDKVEKVAGQLLAAGDNSGNSALDVFGDYLGTDRLVQLFESRLLGAEKMSPRMVGMISDVYAAIDNFARAAALLDKGLEKMPGNNDLMYRRLNLMMSMRDPRQSIAYLEKTVAQLKKGDPNGFQWIDRLVSACVQTGDHKRAREVLDGYAIDEAQPWLRMARARLYLMLGDGGKALADIEAAGTEGQSRNYAQTVICALIRNGRVEEAMTKWREGLTDGNDFETAKHLRETGHVSEAIEVLIAIKDRRPEYFHQYHELASLMREREPESEAWWRMYVEAVSTAGEQSSVRYEFARSIEAFDAAASLFEQGDWKTEPALYHALLRACATEVGEGDADAKARLIELLNAKLPAPSDVLFACAAGLREAGETELARAVYVSIGENEDSDVNALTTAAGELAQLNDNAAAQVYTRVLERGGPEQPVDLLAACRVAAANDTPEWKAFVDGLPKLAGDDVNAAFCRAYMDFIAGRKEAALSALDALPAPDTLYSSYSSELISMYLSADRVDRSIAILEQIAAGGFGRPQRTKALERLVTLYLTQGDMEKAWKTFLRMSSLERLHSVGPWRAMCEAFTPETLRPLVEQAIAESPSRDRTSDLIVLLSDVSAAHDVAFDADALATAMGVQGRELEEARLHLNMIETWSIAKGMQLKGGVDAMDTALSDAMRAAMAPDVPLPQDGHTWTQTAATDGPGYVWLDQLFGDNTDRSYNHLGFALTELTCPSDMEVTFTHSSDDWVRIWINGEEVHRNSRGRTAFLDQDRFTAKLRGGKNRVFLQIGNYRDHWGFALGMIDAPEGVQPATVP